MICQGLKPQPSKSGDSGKPGISNDGQHHIAKGPEKDASMYCGKQAVFTRIKVALPTPVETSLTFIAKSNAGYG